jgi:hypothetical protein
MSVTTVTRFHAAEGEEAALLELQSERAAAHVDRRRMRGFRNPPGPVRSTIVRLYPDLVIPQSTRRRIRRVDYGERSFGEGSRRSRRGRRADLLRRGVLSRTARPRTPGSGDGLRRYDPVVRCWKPSRPVLIALVILHIIVTVITLRDLSQRTDTQVRGPRWFWRLFAPLQMGNSAVYWLVGRKSGS